MNLTKHKIIFKLTCYESVLTVVWLVFIWLQDIRYVMKFVITG
jgi:hypothetical protein